MVYVPTNNWYITENTEDCDIYMPKRTFIASRKCMICSRVGNDVKTYILRTMYPRYEYKVCTSMECAIKLKKGYAEFLRSGEIITIDNEIFRNICSVRRTSGAIDCDWSVMGFVTAMEGVTKIMMSKNDITKAITYEQFIELNPTLTQAINTEIEDFFDSCLCTIKNIMHDTQ